MGLAKLKEIINIIYQSLLESSARSQCDSSCEYSSFAGEEIYFIGTHIP